MSSESHAQDVGWDLETLVYGKGEAGVAELLDEADRRVGDLAAKKGQVASFDSPALADFMVRLAELRELAGRAGSYASLAFSTEMTNESRGALVQKVQERATAMETQLLFFELEWAQLSDERVDELLDGDGLDHFRHYLRSERRYRDYLLTEPEERILTEKSVTGRSAWSRLFGELTSAISVELDGEASSLEQALSRLASPDRDVRRDTAGAITKSLESGVRTRAFIFNTLLYDKATDDRLRGFPTWLTSRNLSNEATNESVEALVSTVRDRYDLPQRWYKLKARLLGLDRLADYDRLATLSEDDVVVEWPEAREIVLDGYRSFSSDLADLASQFFTDNWIDAPLRPGKRPGAFCSYTVPSHHPYVFLNYTARRRDVLTLAHELGHGVHAALARPQGVYHQSTPLTLAETASVFGETIVFGRLLEAADTPQSRLALLAEHVEGTIATVFRQTAMNRFEDLVHTARREEGELSIERFGDLWMESQNEMMADSVDMTDDYRSWWSYVPHFIGTPGYVYAYSYGQLLALAVYNQYEEQGAAFVPDYLKMLSAGGSMPPEELGRIVGCDLTDPGFWAGGLAIVEKHLVAAETAAAEVPQDRAGS
jgi:oligoendopeptidase F